MISKCIQQKNILYAVIGLSRKNLYKSPQHNFLPFLIWGEITLEKVPSALLAVSSNKRFFTSCLALCSPMGGPTELRHMRRLVEGSYGLGYFCQVTKM